HRGDAGWWRHFHAGYGGTVTQEAWRDESGRDHGIDPFGIRCKTGTYSSANAVYPSASQEAVLPKCGWKIRAGRKSQETARQKGRGKKVPAPPGCPPLDTASR